MMAAKITISHRIKMGMSPREILETANTSIVHNNPEEMFVTIWLGILDLNTGTLTAVNAGHECPMLMKPKEYFELVKDPHGLVLGGTDPVFYNEYFIQMDPGSLLFLYTDGLVEAANEKNQMFGELRTLAVLNKVRKERPEVILEKVREAEVKFVNGQKPFDDLTMICLAYYGQKKDEEV